MIWALLDGVRAMANPKQEAKCPLCGESVISKCGEIKVWHWAHKCSRECDDWAEKDSEWHIKWQNEFPAEQQEVIMDKSYEGYKNKHRADIVTRTGKIIEIQSSQISIDKIKEREQFYGSNMIWLLNGETIAKNVYFNPRNKKCSWRWPPAISKASRPIFVDTSFGIVKYSEEEFDSHIFTKEQFLQIYGDVYQDGKRKT